MKLEMKLQELNVLRKKIYNRNHIRHMMECNNNDILELITDRLNSLIKCNITKMRGDTLFIKLYKTNKASIDDIKRIINDMVHEYDASLDYNDILSIYMMCDKSKNNCYIKIK